jgi:hypothetical protein
VLHTQHQAGRRVTDRVFVKLKSLKTQEDRNNCSDVCSL